MTLNYPRLQSSSSAVSLTCHYLSGLLWPGLLIPVKSPIYGFNRYLYSAVLRLYPFIENVMEVNAEYKSGVEMLRQLDVGGGFLPATPAAELIPKVLPCIPCQ